MSHTTTSDLETLITELDALEAMMLRAAHDDDGSFARVFDAFLNLAMTSPLMRLSHSVSRAELDALLQAALEELEADGGPLEHVRMMELPGRGFFHGAFCWQERHGAFFWCDRVASGLGVLINADGSSVTFRISLCEMTTH